jgi:hypothetical protein
MVHYLFIVKGFGYREAATSVAAGRAAWSGRAVPNVPRNNIVATCNNIAASQLHTVHSSPMEAQPCKPDM